RDGLAAGTAATVRRAPALGDPRAVAGEWRVDAAPRVHGLVHPQPGPARQHAADGRMVRHRMGLRLLPAAAGRGRTLLPRRARRPGDAARGGGRAGGRGAADGAGPVRRVAGDVVAASVTEVVLPRDPCPGYALRGTTLKKE